MTNRLAAILHGGENGVAYLALSLLVLFPFMEVVARELLHTGVDNSTVYLEQLVLIVTFIAGSITSRQKKHLSLAVDLHIPEPFHTVSRTVVNILCSALVFAFAWSSLSFAYSSVDADRMDSFNLRLILMILAGFALVWLATWLLRRRFATLEKRIGLLWGRILHYGAGLLAAAATFACAWGAARFFLKVNIFRHMPGVDQISLRLVALVMAFGYLAMAVRFISGLEYKKGRAWGRLLGLVVAVIAGAILAFPSIINLFAVPPGAPRLLAGLQAPLQAAVSWAATPLIILLIIAAFFGAPIFVVLGGIAYLLFARHAEALEVIPNQAYGLLTGHSIAAIPLFTVTGFLLSESKAGERLIKLFRAVFSWIPGGLAVMAILVCAFFTTFTGASGVTIVALGGLLSYILINSGYGKKFAVGLLTASGSIGLLFPPSLPVIIYGATATINIKEMFKGGILPGLALVLTMAIASVVYALGNRVPRHPFNLGETLAALRTSVWEILLPLVIFISYFGVWSGNAKRIAAILVYLLTLDLLTRGRGKEKNAAFFLGRYLPPYAAFLLLVSMPELRILGISPAAEVSWFLIALFAAVAFGWGLLFDRLARRRHGGNDEAFAMPAKDILAFVWAVAGVVAILAAASSISLNPVECAAVSVVYALFIEMGVHRDLRLKDLPGIVQKCLPIIGGVLTILALASGLAYYIIDADIPTNLTHWVQTGITSKYVFLLLLNLALLVVGCFMDIFSAILVVVPLIKPLGDLFHIQPIHLGIIFLANLELGYLTPPVGLNLYLSSYRFNEPIAKVYRDVLLFLMIQLATVLLITYVPFLTTALLAK